MCVCLRVISVLNKIIVFRVTGWIASLQLIGLVHAYVTSLDCHMIRLNYIYKYINRFFYSQFYLVGPGTVVLTRHECVVAGHTTMR